MGERRKARESALQILFQLEFSPDNYEEVIEEYWKERKANARTREYANWLVRGVISSKEKIDNIIEECSENWRLSRMATVDRNILRIATFELLSEQDIPHPVIINEAIEIAKKYGTEESGQFVNGILDTIRKKIRKGKKNEESED
ncbi:transcription antitermination factor NusB [Candidatus Aminicenantes bacterium AC-708-M15]|jgi:N utilization substance protein B|nr:transcription antitermination factor NusB [SCandidatus Aminicenantes bacterium Aminicenantia_JdfR_composite]MCP2596462.1 transcription antitermination factor NusB [Candidatus Aminicenantes bacterium AC-335-G13]MCP2598152.1 transcription antitermination factor NusB [Candidatus Aminicenantes bacterium AC-335-L06]MCP2598914.1 transcription antitermination factor NusB [Candidatus Aminicenantes bacterium AC-335-B20]MCP2603858.1 transcription antitermination factor NusB [Candidatus Aminicenantes b